jgi:hypothetical protein
MVADHPFIAEKFNRLQATFVRVKFIYLLFVNTVLDVVFLRLLSCSKICIFPKYRVNFGEYCTLKIPWPVSGSNTRKQQTTLVCRKAHECRGFFPLAGSERKKIQALVAILLNNPWKNVCSAMLSFFFQCKYV